MAINVKQLLKILIPEYQIKVCVNERGFIAKKQSELNHTHRTIQTISQGEVQHQTEPTDLTPIQQENISSAGAETVYEPRNTDTKGNNKILNEFDDLSQQLKKYWVGTQEDREAVCKAFKRPYVRGFDNVKPRNSMLILGTESRGKVYAIRCISVLLKQKKVFKYEQISVVDMEDYVADSANTLFLSDLYKALNTNTETIVFENIEKASLIQLDIVYQLMVEGVYKLAKRYMVSNGGLTEATGVLNTGLISMIEAKGKYFVFTSSVSQSKVISILGNKIVKEIDDIIVLDTISQNQVRDLAYTLSVNYVERCRQNLHLDITFSDLAMEVLGSKYNEKVGIKGLENYIDEQIYQPLTEMKLQGMLSDDDKITITYEDGECVIVKEDLRIPTSRYIKKYDVMGLEEVQKELQQVIGLTAVKDYVMSLETNYKVQQMRQGAGLKNSDISMHMIFTGNPGTGKTTIARIVAKYLKAIGVLSSGHLCEVARGDLVGQYAGHTAIKTRDVINSAIGGVLFIDEAYSLYRDKSDVFGLEAVDTLVKGMEDNRGDLVVILAGYEEEMQNFLKTNSGLKSRFPNIVHFEDYTVEEMYEIAKVTAASKGYNLDEGCKDGLLQTFEKSQIKGRNDGGNGRLVRNLIESAVIKQSQRIIQDPEADMELLLASDFGFGNTVEFDLEKRLSDVIGLETVKEFIRLQNTMIQANRKRKMANIEVDTTQALNMLFTGNPGTGKTTMARIVADMFHSMGILKSGQLVEVDKGGLIAQYVGQTAKKTEEVFKSALGGVLFIDEAYAITNDGGSYGKECIDTLVKLIEDYQGEIVVILAGYSKEMSEFMKSNSGLESRFPLKIEFPDYSAKELFEIAQQMIAKRGFSLGNGAVKVLEEEITRLKWQANASSGNARMIRNYVEEIIRKQSARIAKDDVTNEWLMVILPEDIRLEREASKVFDLENALAKVIGLDSVKKYIRSLNARLKLQAERKKAGLKADNTQTMHMIFAGNPGTGKTMMARTVADVLYNMNVISSNKLVETDRSGLVAGYVGQTAIKTRQVVESALGGVLFVDEAYALAQGGENDFGQEAIDTLVKMMDDNRDRLVVILAGYSDDMKRFLDKNAGLQSRFANIIEFPDYTLDELMQIAEGLYATQGYILSEDGKEALREKIAEEMNDKRFGNGRYVRNVFERSLNNQALRLSNEKDFSKEMLTVITENDIREAK